MFVCFSRVLGGKREFATYHFVTEEIKRNDLFRVQAELLHASFISCTDFSTCGPLPSVATLHRGHVKGVSCYQHVLPFLEMFISLFLEVWLGCSSCFSRIVALSCGFPRKRSPYGSSPFLPHGNP